MRGGSLLACAMSVVMIAGGCGSHTGTPTSTETAGSGAALPGSFGGEDPGSLLTANTLPTVDRRLSAVSSVAAKITYLSTSGVDGSRQRISGTVFAPAGKPPADGWPVIAYGHATTGIQPECAPSLDPMLLGLSATVTGLVKAGFVVAVSDYQGLGVDGSYHPYLDATTEGYNLIDSVRAARKLVSATSKRWAAFGGSQGGQAAWAANELARQYAPELDLVGSASYSPPLAIDGFADGAAEGTLTPDQRLAFLQILAALAEESADFRLDDYRRGLAAEKWNVLLACKGPDAAERDQLGDRLTSEDVAPASPEAADALRRRLLDDSLPRQPATAPLLIVYGGQDQLVSPTWTSRALDAACRMGDVIQIELQPDKGHDDVDGGSAFPWINDRFAGAPARNDCAAFLPPGEPTE